MLYVVLPPKELDSITLFNSCGGEILGKYYAVSLKALVLGKFKIKQTLKTSNPVLSGTVTCSHTPKVQMSLGKYVGTLEGLHSAELKPQGQFYCFRLNDYVTVSSAVCGSKQQMKSLL